MPAVREGHTSRDKARAIGEALWETSEGNPRLTLDVRFYADGHSSVMARDEHNHAASPSMPCPDDAQLIVQVAQALVYAARKARRESERAAA